MACRLTPLAFAACVWIFAPATSGLAQATITVPGIAHIHVAAPVRATHIMCMKPVDAYLASLLAAAGDSKLPVLHRQAHYRDYLAVQKMDWGVPSRAKAEAMMKEAEAGLIAEKADAEKFRQDLQKANARAAEPTNDRFVRDINAQTVAAAKGLLVYQQSRVRYQEAKLAFARCALGNQAR